jgi:hypothetical protein
MISRVPSPTCRSGVIGLAIAGNPEMTGTWRPGKRRSGMRVRDEDIPDFVAICIAPRLLTIFVRHTDTSNDGACSHAAPDFDHWGSRQRG